MIFNEIVTNNHQRNGIFFRIKRLSKIKNMKKGIRTSQKEAQINIFEIKLISLFQNRIILKILSEKLKEMQHRR